MKWVRHVVVYLLSLILLVCTLGLAVTTSSSATLTHPTKLENWLTQSNLYPNLQNYITTQAQTSVTESIAGATTISSSIVKQAVQSSFPKNLLQQSVAQFINGNYAWLEGDQATPNYKIDLSGPKLQFATQIADAAVVSHFSSLPTCTIAQASQLQSANPLLLSCRPPGVSLQTESALIGQQLASGGSFLNNPVITASTLGSSGNDGGEPYFIKLHRLPHIYQTIQKLPPAFGVVVFISILGIIFCDISKRRGLRKIGIVLIISGLILVLGEVVTNDAFNRVKGQAFTSVNSGQLQQSLISFLHSIESELVKISLWFGIAYVVIGLLIVVFLIATRGGKVKSSTLVGKSALNQNNTSVVPPSPTNYQPNSSSRGALSTNTAPKSPPRQRPPRPRPPRLIQ